MAIPIANDGTDSLAVSMLKDDHRKLQALFVDYDLALSPDQRRSLATQISSRMKVHLEVKERLFYPFLLTRLADINVVDKAAESHAAAHDAITAIDTIDKIDEVFDTRIAAMRQSLAEHIEMEEEEIYPMLDEFREGLDALGKEMAAVRQQLESQVSQAELDHAHGIRSGTTVAERQDGHALKSMPAATE